MKPDTPESESQLELKKSARRRLIGSAFFVIVAAAVLPMIMDAAPPPQLNDFRIVTAEERTAAPVMPPAPVPPVPPEAESTVVQRDAVAQNNPTDVVPAKPVESTPAAPVVVVPATPAEPAGPVPVVEKPEAPKPSDKPVEKKVEKPVEKKADKKDGKDGAEQAAQYYIQVGVFADIENVKQVRAKLKAQGISSWTEEASGNLAGKTRVKAGPFPNKEAADKALAKISKVGLNGMIAKK